MKDDGRKKKKDKKKPSALNVVKGVEGGHDGLPGRKTTTPSRKKAEPRSYTTEEYIKGILGGDRVMLSRAITLIESNAPHHQEQAQEVLKAIMPHTGNSIRVGITGVPGAGKSTLIEVFGTYLIERNHKVAVMAVDPSSSLTKGSILGDKTRMERLGQAPEAFIRPSPSGGTLGGVARKTRETMLVFEAAGFDVLLVETVGVGQSEITVRSMVDFFLLVLMTGAGDELQRIKKGVFEMADMILINKADGKNTAAAETAREEYERALHYLQPVTRGWTTCARTASAFEKKGIGEIWEVIEQFRELTEASGEFDKRRREQTRDWLHSLVNERLQDAFYRAEVIEKRLPEIEQDVMEGKIPAVQAARDLLKTFKEYLIERWTDNSKG
jgi:LAO/AO transport system kinase